MGTGGDSEWVSFGVLLGSTTRLLGIVRNQALQNGKKWQYGRDILYTRYGFFDC